MQRGGVTESFSVKITEDMMRSFCIITGDVNPLHTDVSFARKKGFPDVVAYGMLTASFISTLAGVYLPGKNCLIHSVSCKFLRPVILGDILQITGVVNCCHESVGEVEIKVTMVNQRGEKVLKGTLCCGVLNE